MEKKQQKLLQNHPPKLVKHHLMLVGKRQPLSKWHATKRPLQQQRPFQKFQSLFIIKKETKNKVMEKENNKETILPEEKKHPLFEGDVTEFKDASGNANDPKAAEVKASVEFLKPGSDAGTAQEVNAEEVKEEGPLFSQNNQLTKSDGGYNLPMQTFDMAAGNAPDLDDAEIIPIDLVSNYWTPENFKEFKNVYFIGFQMAPYRDQENEDVVIELETAFFVEKSNGNATTWCNASKRLVAALKQNHINEGTPIRVTFMGKKKNSTNQYKSDMWSVNLLMAKVK